MNYISKIDSSWTFEIITLSLSHIKFMCGLRKHDIVMSKLKSKLIPHKMRSVKKNTLKLF